LFTRFTKMVKAWFNRVTNRNTITDNSGQYRLGPEYDVIKE